MTDLKPRHPLEGLDETIGTVRIAAFDPGPVTALAPWPGTDPDAALAPLGLQFPAAGQTRTAGRAHLVWAGRQMAFLIGIEPPAALAETAALTDQSDGWAWLHLNGTNVAAVLARLCPLDLRPTVFAPGTSARSIIGHMQALIIRTGHDAFELAVFASMAGTLRHDIETAARAVAARNALP